MHSSEPLVSIVTPLYNCAEYLEQCIESVLAQSYRNWHHTIVNNCSTDASGEIARRYAARDARIKIVEADTFLLTTANHNRALRHISPDCKYVKMVFADDWLFPQCLDEMVTVAEHHPSVGLVGAYGMQGSQVKWAGLPYPSTVTPGREVCRQYFLKGLNPFGTAHSVLFRADLVRARDPFYDESNWHSDREACIALLRNCDFGFVHQVLTFTRDRAGSLNDIAAKMNTYVAGTLNDVLLHGRAFLTSDEYSDCVESIIKEYYNYLAVSVLRCRRDAPFWRYHKDKLTKYGVGFSKTRIAMATVSRLCRAVLNPNETLDKIHNASDRAR